MANAPQHTPKEILSFWFSEPVRGQWFASTPSLDMRIKHHYKTLWDRARSGQLDAWRETAEGALALIIILDQFPLNMFRGEARGFDTEAQARHVARQAIAQGFDEQLTKEQVAFLYLPFMHSEDLADQDYSVALYTRAELDYNLKFARHHRRIIRRFGRFPHRNAILGRESTQEEQGWLASDEAFRG